MTATRVIVLATEAGGRGGIAQSLPTLLATLDGMGALAAVHATHRSAPRQRILPAGTALARLPIDIARIRASGGRALVFAHAGGPVCLARMAPLLALARSLGATVWVQLHSAQLDSWLTGPRAAVVRAWLSPAHAIFAGTDHYADQYRAAGLHPVHTLAPALPPEVLRALDREPSRPPPPPSLHVLTAGRLVAGKGLEVVVDAVRDTDDRLVVAGEGPLMQALRTRAHPMAERVSFPGWVAPLSPLLDAADVFVLPSMSDTFGLTAVLAVAHGVPTVVADTPVTREVLGDVVLRTAPTAEAVGIALDRIRSGEWTDPSPGREHLRARHSEWNDSLRHYLESV